MRKFLTPAEFREQAKSGVRATDVGVRIIARLATDQSNMSDQQSRWVFSDASVDRYGDTIRVAGWVLDAYRANPVVLWAHDASAPPVGRTLNIQASDVLLGDIEYAAEEIYGFAETVRRLVKGGFLNAGSVGFNPLEWEFTKDKSRPGGIDFKKQELLEYSICPVPANANALVQARAAGISTQPIYEWAEKVLDTGALIMVPKSEIETLRKAAKTPTLRPKAGEIKMAKRVAKSLWHVGWLANLLADLDFLEDCVEWESAIEDDGSPVPEQLQQVVNQLGQILVDMTIEEVSELLADEEAEGADTSEVDGVVVASAKTPAQKAFVFLAKMALKASVKNSPRFVVETPRSLSGSQTERIQAAVAKWMINPSKPLVLSDGLQIRDLSAPRSKPQTIDQLFEQIKAGRVLSAKNEADLKSARDLIDGVVAQVEKTDDAADESKSLLQRAMARVRVLKLTK